MQTRFEGPGRAVRHSAARRFFSLSAASAIALSWLFAAVPGAWAEGNIHAGQLQINPSLKVSDTFDDNIYNTAEAEKDDSIITYMPGLQLERAFGRHRAEAQYNSVMSVYRTYKQENTTDHNAAGLVDFKFGSFLGLTFSDIFRKGHEERGSSATGFIEKFRTNTATISATYQLVDRSKVQFDGSKSTWDFTTPASTFRDRDETLVSGYLYYRFLPKTSAFIEVDSKNVTFVDPTVGLDNVTLTAYTGLRWDMSDKSKGSVKAGLLKKDFESPLQQDHDSWSGALDLRHAITDRTNLDLVGERVVHEANLIGTRFVTVTGLFGELSHRFFSKFQISARSSYAINEFSDPVPPSDVLRRDRIASSGAGFKYFMGDRLEFGIDYSTSIRRSNIPVNDFKVHITTIGATLSL